MQAISAWLSACRCGNGDTAADAAMVRRAGGIIARHGTRDRGKAAEVKKHTVESFVKLASQPVWGGEDVFLRAVY